MKFEKIIPALKEGNKIKRKGWEKGQYIKIHDFFVVGKIVTEDNINYALTVMDLEADDWEIVKETKKVKLRDLSEEQYGNWRDNHCNDGYFNCNICPFVKVVCIGEKKFNNVRIRNKELYSDKLLDQEIEVEE